MNTIALGLLVPAKRSVLIALGLCWISLSVSSAQAQAPSAGSIQQNIDQEINSQKLPPKTIQSIIPAQRDLKPTGVTFILKKVAYKGNTLLSNSQLDVVVAPYLNQELDYSKLQALSYAIENAYKDAGYLARVRLPEQELQGGTLHLEIQEAIFGKSRVEGTSVRVSPEQIIAIIDAQQQAGQPINIDHLDRGLLLADDLPGVTVGGVLIHGTLNVTTDLGVKVEDENLLYGSALMDNTGPTSTGSFRVLGNVGINSPAGIGDLLSATYLYSEGSNYGRLAYTAPVGNDGVRVGVNASALDYKIISGTFAPLGGYGSAQTVGLESSYPLIRSRSANLYVSANADYRQFSNSSSGTLISQYNVMDYSVSMYGNRFDSFAGGGANTASLTLVTGNVDLANSPNQASVASSRGAQGSFTKIRYNATRNQYLLEDTSLFGSITGQFTNQNLDSSEQFYLGGAYGVRAYPTSEGAGSTGQLLTVELRQKLPQNIVAALFYDYGRLNQNANNNINGASSINQYALQGAGLSLGWRPVKAAYLNITYAHRIGTNPNPTLTGNDQDGTQTINRFWLSASYAF